MLREAQALKTKQRDATRFILRHRFCAIWGEMGVGKTAITLSALAPLLDRFLVAQVLIVAPKQVATHTWPAEIGQWEHTHHLSHGLIRGTEKQRIKQLSEYQEIHIINHELIPWLVEYFGKDWPYDVVVLDEADAYKNAASKRFKALKKVRKFITRMIQLTGTPAANGLEGLWSQLYLLDGGKRLEKTLTRYRQRYFYPNYNRHQWFIQMGAKAHIFERVADICYRLDNDKADLPGITYHRHSVCLSDAARETYDALSKDLVVELGDTNVMAATSEVLIGKLMQVANGALYLDDGAFAVVHDAKIEALKHIIEANPDESILVATQFKSDIERIKAALPHAQTVDDGEDVFARWNAGEIPLLVAQNTTISHGLNLQFGGSRIVWFGLTWALDRYLQFNARLYRKGQKTAVKIHHLVAEDTIDVHIMDALRTKAFSQQQLLDAAKHHHQKEVH